MVMRFTVPHDRKCACKSSGVAEWSRLDIKIDASSPPPTVPGTAVSTPVVSATSSAAALVSAPALQAAKRTLLHLCHLALQVLQIGIVRLCGAVA